MSTGSADERSTLALTLKAAGRGAGDRSQLMDAAREFGEDGAKGGASLPALLVELDHLESEIIVAGKAIEMHELCAAARRVMVAAFARVARHDMVNAVGAARNAFLLIEEGGNSAELKRLRDIARRNLQTAERLARVYFSESELRRDDVAIGSSGNERNDLGRAGERDHGDAVGF